MKDVERKLISAMIKQEKVSDFVKQGFTDEDFIAFPHVIKWILYCSREGYTVNEALLTEEFPEFEFAQEDYDFRYVLDKFFEDYAKIKSRSVLLEQPTTMTEWIPQVIAGLSEILQKRDGSTIIDFNKIGDRFLTYTERAESEYYHLGIPLIDNTLGGISYGSNFAIIASQKVGKTWFLAHLANILSTQGAHVMIITKEISDEAFRNRLDSIRFDLDYRKVRTGTLEKEEFDRWRRELDEIGTHNEGKIQIVYERNHTLDAIPSYIKEHSPDVLLIDGAYLWAKSFDWREIAQVTKTIARWSKDFERLSIGYTWQSNAVDTDDLKKSQIAFGKLNLLADVDFSLGINRTPEMKERNLMQVSILNSRDSADSSGGFIGWNFGDKNYPTISHISDEFELQDLTDPDAMIIEL